MSKRIVLMHVGRRTLEDLLSAYVPPQIGTPIVDARRYLDYLTGGGTLDRDHPSWGIVAHVLRFPATTRVVGITKHDQRPDVLCLRVECPDAAQETWRDRSSLL